MIEYKFLLFLLIFYLHRREKMSLLTIVNGLFVITYISFLSILSINRFIILLQQNDYQPHYKPIISERIIIPSCCSVFNLQYIYIYKRNFILFYFYTLRHVEHEILGRVSSTINKSNLNFKYEMLEKATGYFHPSRKLGQGGAGAVFRGILPDGSSVAVKRLFFNTRQWVDDFFNEVNLISGIQHKNLVKLLGCSIEGPESLLVYEYVANKSLDNFFFGNFVFQLL